MIRSKGGRFVITPDGMLTEWDRQDAATDSVIAELESVYNEKSHLLFVATAVGADERFGLTSDGS